MVEAPQYKRIAKIACEHVSTRRECGCILNQFTSKLSTSDAAHFIIDVICQDFFLDQKGSTNLFFAEIHNEEVRQLAEGLLKDRRTVTKDGELVESDEDSTGNLRYEGHQCIPAMMM